MDADSSRQLGTLLANISVGGTTNQAQLAANVGEYEAAGLLGMSDAATTAINSLSQQFGERQGRQIKERE